jgi:hypothetical protein
VNGGRPHGGSARGWRPHGWLARGRDAYGVVLATVFSVLILAPFERHATRPVIVVLLAALLIFTMWTSGVGNRVLVPSVVVSLACAAAAATSELKPSERGSRLVFTAIAIALSAATIVVIIIRFGTHVRVTIRTITGALSVYLLIGLTFTYLFVMLGEIRNSGFFAQPGLHSPAEFLYFSFITLTTVGFGDLTAGNDPGRMMAVVEALIGQLYLVTVVALVVGNVGQRRRRLRSADQDED